MDKELKFHNKLSSSSGSKEGKWGVSTDQNVAFHIITYMYYMHYVTIHASHNIPSMYHFTHGYTHRLHTRMQAIVRTYNLPVHTPMHWRIEGGGQGGLGPPPP